MNHIIKYYLDKNLKTEDIIYKIRKKIVFFKTLLIIYVIILLYTLAFLIQNWTSYEIIALLLIFFIAIISQLIKYTKALNYFKEKDS